MVGGRDMNGLGCIFAKTKTQDPCNVEQSWEVRDEKEYIDDTSIVVDECPAGTDRTVQRASTWRVWYICFFTFTFTFWQTTTLSQRLLKLGPVAVVQ